MRHQHGGNIYAYTQVVDFSANINPLGMPEAVRAAAIEGVASAMHYPEAENGRLKNAIAAYESASGPAMSKKADAMSEKSDAASAKIDFASAKIDFVSAKAEDLSIRSEQVLCGNGAAELIMLTGLALRPAAAVLFAPSFAEYAQAMQLSQTEIERLYLKEADDFCITDETIASFSDIVSRRADSSRPVEMLFLCQPNNPTGQTLSSKLVEKIVAICERYQIWLVIDACFLELMDEDERMRQKAVLARCLQYKKTLILKALTKSFAMAGLRLGYLIAADETVILQLQNYLQPWNVSLPAQYAGLAALSENDFLAKSRQYVQTEKKSLVEALTEMAEKGLIQKVYGHDANFIFFKAAEDLWEQLLAKGILIRDCQNYPGLQKGYYRIAVRTQKENRQLIEALRAIAEKGR